METIFQVDGIMCPKCVAKVTAALTALGDVTAVQVSQDYQTVTIAHGPAVQPESMKNAIESIPERKFTVLG
jgi:copper chaperone CopZ